VLTLSAGPLRGPHIVGQAGRGGSTLGEAGRKYWVKRFFFKEPKRKNVSLSLKSRLP